jgi:Cu/Ag efflux protein CusF
MDDVSGELVAIKIEGEDNSSEDIDEDDGDDANDDDDEIKMEGVVSSDGVADGKFEMNGQTIMVTDSTEFKQGSVDMIQHGVMLEIEGAMSDGMIVAKKIEFEDIANIKIAGQVETVGDTTVTVMGVEVHVTSSTMMHGKSYDDDEAMMSPMDVEVSMMDSFQLSDLTEGDNVKIHAYMDGERMVAAKIKLEDADDDSDDMDKSKLEGAITEVSDSSITVAGVVVDVSMCGEMSLQIDDMVEISGMYDSETMMLKAMEIEIEGTEDEIELECGKDDEGGDEDEDMEKDPMPIEMPEPIEEMPVV